MHDTARRHQHQPAHPPAHPCSVAHKLMKTETLDWVPIPLWVACAGNALRAGLAQFPDSAFLNIQLVRQLLPLPHVRRQGLNPMLCRLPRSLGCHAVPGRPLPPLPALHTTPQGTFEAVLRQEASVRFWLGWPGGVHARGATAGASESGPAAVVHFPAGDSRS